MYIPDRYDNISIVLTTDKEYRQLKLLKVILRIMLEEVLLQGPLEPVKSYIIQHENDT